MSPRRRTALVSVVAAVVLILLKLGAGLAAHSLGLVSEALHSGTDLVAALLTLFAIGVALLIVDLVAGAHPNPYVSLMMVLGGLALFATIFAALKNQSA